MFVAIALIAGARDIHSKIEISCNASGAPMIEEPKIVGKPISGQGRIGRRSALILPNLFTAGNIFCGYYAILSTMRGNYEQSAWSIGIAMILDMLDGRIARLTNSISQFGLQLDSLADVISFGIAPSTLVLAWGLAVIDPRLAWTAAFTFAVCGAMRLARFNTQAGQFRHFVGLPIPAGGGVIAAIVHFAGGSPITDPVIANLMAGVVFLLSFLMVSTIRYSSLKHLNLRKPFVAILAISLLVALIYKYSRPSLLTIAVAYSLSGPACRLITRIRRKRPIELHLSEPLEHY
jgi:CDP-diacylglycerol---serine O-phosphatidyltransferase